MVYIPLISWVHSPYHKLWTDIFSSSYWPASQSEYAYKVSPIRRQGQILTLVQICWRSKISQLPWATRGFLTFLSSLFFLSHHGSSLRKPLAPWVIQPHFGSKFLNCIKVFEIMSSKGRQWQQESAQIWIILTNFDTSVGLDRIIQPEPQI